ncbi:hypothetical protein MMA231_01345 [Asticcacaulis sp. MM231]|uniref:hypothetical protein n=1 Tax=Asticcacaulis sp. MM231 TaxID=3157666 RepID=UPI0032D57499
MVGKVYIANFGRENYAWDACLKRSCIATMNAVEDHGYWLANDRESYCAQRMARKTWAGIFPPKAVASRWFNLMTIITESVDDIWIHRAGNDIWWTVSTDQPGTFETMVEPVGERGEVVICYKPALPWSKTTKSGNGLAWSAMHVKAKDFLITESTLQQLNPDYADYARAMINGNSLAVWHSRPEWKTKQGGGRSPGKILNPTEKSIYEMVQTALKTTANSNGQTVERILKNKDLRMSPLELEEYIMALIKSQDGLCAISGLPLQFRGSHEDVELLASLDRIDSDGHYERGNLQIVCRFLNRWKSDSNDAEFKRLVEVLRA